MRRTAPAETPSVKWPIRSWSAGVDHYEYERTEKEPLRTRPCRRRERLKLVLALT